VAVVSGDTDGFVVCGVGGASWIGVTAVRLTVDWAQW
jgi:hypothetical protein